MRIYNKWGVLAKKILKKKGGDWVDLLKPVRVNERWTKLVIKAS